MTTATNFMNERLCGRWTGSELHNGRGGGKDVVAVAVVAAVVVAVVDCCLSIGALFCQWVAQKCCSISMHYAADTGHWPLAIGHRQRGWLQRFRAPQLQQMATNCRLDRQLRARNLTLRLLHIWQRLPIYIVIMLQSALISLPRTHLHAQ